MEWLSFDAPTTREDAGTFYILYRSHRIYDTCSLGCGQHGTTHIGQANARMPQQEDRVRGSAWWLNWGHVAFPPYRPSSRCVSSVHCREVHSSRRHPSSHLAIKLWTTCLTDDGTTFLANRCIELGPVLRFDRFPAMLCLECPWLGSALLAHHL